MISDDPEMLALAAYYVKLLTQTPAGEGDFEVLRLKYAIATEAAKVLDEAFNGPPRQQGQGGQQGGGRGGPGGGRGGPGGAPGAPGGDSGGSSFNPMSMMMQHWYRAFATLPGSTMNYVQIELYDKLGAFAAGTVQTGTFPVDTNPATCGVCVRGLGDKGAADAKEYFATTGTVTISSIGGNGGTLTATLSNLGFVELDSNRHPVSGGCTATLAAAIVSGALAAMLAVSAAGGWRSAKADHLHFPEGHVAHGGH